MNSILAQWQASIDPAGSGSTILFPVVLTTLGRCNGPFNDLWLIDGRGERAYAR